MSELPQGIDPEIFEDLHISLQGIALCQILQRPTELWEMVQLVRADRAMVRGEVYRYDGLKDAYRAAGIARTIVQKLEGIRERQGEVIQSLRQFMARVNGAPADPEVLELVVAFITISQKGREAVARWIADPEHLIADATGKIKVITGIVDGYQRALREWRPVPPPPSSPLDQTVRPQLTPRFQKLDRPLTGPLLPAQPPIPPLAAPRPEPHPAKSAPSAAVPAAKAVSASAAMEVATFTAQTSLPEDKPPRPRRAEAPAAAPAVARAPAPPAPAPSSEPNTVSLILPRGVNTEILEDVRRVDQCRKIFEETHQEIEVWEVFCLVMLDSEFTRVALEKLLLQKQNGEKQGFTEGALALFERLLKIRAQHGKFVRDLRGFLGQLPVGTFGKDTMEMALGFIVASSRGRDRAQQWLSEPGRYRQEAAGRLEDVISRTMNYQTALRMIPS